MAKKKSPGPQEAVSAADTPEQLLRRIRKSIDDIPTLVRDRSTRALQVIGERLHELAMKRPSVSTEESKVDLGDRSELALLNDGANVAERLINKSNLLPVSFLEQGLERQKAVARIALASPHSGLPAGSGWGTGFLVAPDLLLTNNHVIESSGFLPKIRIEFNFQNLPDGQSARREVFSPAFAGTFRTSVALDYTLIQLQVAPDGALPGDRWGRILLNPTPQFFGGQRLNVIQHPDGREKEVALQDNEITELFENIVRYEADTEPGSSGSPVFDNFWQLVALHHSAGKLGPSGKWLSNQGVRIDRIVADLRGHFSGTGETSVLAELGV